MRRLSNILSAVITLCVILLAASCEKRPLLEVSNTHYIKVYVNEELLNVTTGFYNENYARPEYKSPTVLRVILTDPETGNVKAERYLRNQGHDEHGHYYDGYIIADPGAYKLIAYNFDTESTIIGAGNNHYYINAYTNEIASHLYTKIPSRSPSKNKENQNAQQAAQGEAEGKAPTDPEGKGPLVESIVYDPDHLFVANSDELVIPYKEHVDTLRAIDGTPHFYAESIVKSYFLQVKVKGAQWISSAVSLLEGLSGSISLETRQVNHEHPVIVYFEMLTDANKARTKEDEAVIYTTFGMFGRIQDMDNVLELTFDFMTTYGVPYTTTMNISADFDTPEAVEHQWLLLDQTITIPDPPPSSGTNTGGGFQPSVDEWDDVESDIII